MSEIQSVLLNKNLYDIDSAIKWIIDHKFKLIKLDITNNFYRFRQKDPDLFNSFRIIQKKNVSFVIGF